MVTTKRWKRAGTIPRVFGIRGRHNGVFYLWTNGDVRATARLTFDTSHWEWTWRVSEQHSSGITGSLEDCVDMIQASMLAWRQELREAIRKLTRIVGKRG